MATTDTNRLGSVLRRTRQPKPPDVDWDVWCYACWRDDEAMIRLHECEWHQETSS